MKRMILVGATVLASSAFSLGAMADVVCRGRVLDEPRLFHLTLMLQCATVNQVVICSSYAMAVLISFWIKGLMAFN